MYEFILAISQHTFLQNAIYACLLASLGCGLMGSYVVVKRMGFLVGGISHAVLSGMGIAYFYGQSPLAGAIIAALISAMLIALIKLRLKQDEDILIAAFWSSGMAVGILFIAKTPGYNVDLMSYLFGNILLVNKQDLMLMLCLDGLLLFSIFMLYKQFLIITFDEEFARLRGVDVEIYYTLLLCLIALSIVLMIQMVGLILVLALLVLPAATAALFARSFIVMMVVAVLISLASTLGGLVLSYQPDLPSGALMVIMATVIYMLGLIYQKLKIKNSSTCLKKNSKPA